MIYRIIYCSCNRLSGSNAEVEAGIRSILATSQENNDAAEITGALLFNEKVFAQVLEGPRKSVEKLYRSICSDPRHDRIVLLEAGYMIGRDFANWTMAFAQSDIVNNPFPKLEFEQAKAQPLGTAEATLELLRMMVHARA